MSTDNPEWLDLLKRRAKQAFDRANPSFWNTIQGDPTKVTQAKDIHDRIRSIRLRMETHLHKHRQNWISQEAVKVFNERGGLDHDHLRPSWSDDGHVNVSYLEEARRRVQARIQGRMQRINAVGERMVSQIGHDKDTRQRNPTLQLHVHAIVARTQALRTTAKIHLTTNRDRWIANARDRGADNPEWEVFSRQRARLQRIDRAEHRVIRQAFKRHGHSLPERQDRMLTHDFNYSMG